jgi:streptomycin 6-kinase
MAGSLSGRFHQHGRRWNVIVERTLATETSLIGFGTRDGLGVVLKVAEAEGEEWRSGEILNVFAGKGLVRVLEHTPGAVLLPRLVPGNDLSALSLDGRDTEATEIIAGIIQQMSLVQPIVLPFLTVADQASGFDRFRHNCDGLIEDEVVQKAERCYFDLCATQVNPRLLHGDLHHYNVLFDKALGWVAIDPQGILGEVEFEVGAALRNPYTAPALLSNESTARSRLEIFERRLGFDIQRAAKWAFATAVLAALWPTKPGGVDMRVPFVAAAKCLLGLAE